MKAVIVECSNGAAVALCEDGTFKKVRNKNFSVGQEVYLKENISNSRIMRTLSICASFAFVLLSVAGIGSYSYVTPYSYVSLDINPSIEYALNRYDKVIRVQGINDGGEQIVSSIESEIKNQNITTALGVTISQLEKDNYISKEEDNHVIISVCSNNDNKAQAIVSRVNTFSQEESRLCSIDTLTVSQEVKANADSLGITPGKLALINAVAAVSVDDDFDVSEWTDKTVNELEVTIEQASSNVSGNDSDYLSSILDDSAADADSSVSVSADGAATVPTGGAASGNSDVSTSTAVSDQTNADNPAAPSDAVPDISSGQAVTPPAVSDDAASEPSAADKNDSVAEDGKNFSNATVPDKDSADGSSTEDDDLETSTDSKGSAFPSTGASVSDNEEKNEDGSAQTDADDSLTEETSGKLDMNPDTSADAETDIVESSEENTENTEAIDDAADFPDTSADDAKAGLSD